MTMDTAIHFEGIKYAYRQSKDGIVVSFVVHPNDVPQQLSTSLIGSRYMVALVEIGDDEQPKPVKKERKAEWRDLTPTAQAAIRCGEPQFWQFLARHGRHPENKEECRLAVCDMCGIESRAELSTNQKARVIWHQLDSEYQAWK